MQIGVHPGAALGHCGGHVDVVFVGALQTQLAFPSLLGELLCNIGLLFCNRGQVNGQESVKILENIPQAGIGRRRIWEPETLPKDIRLINSHYDDLYRIPDGGVIQVDYPDGRSFTARVEHLDDYHFDMGGLGNVFHICQFAEVMERNHADFYPEIQTQDEQAAWELGGKGYLAIQSCEDGWDYTLYHSDYSVMDGGQLDAPELTIQEAREQILETHHMEKGRRLLQDYDAVMDKVAEAEELSADHRPSTLEKLAELASDTSAPKSSARSAPEL